VVNGVTHLPFPAVRLHDDRFAAERLAAVPRLRSFVVDEANSYAIAATHAVLEVASPPPIVLIHGPSGVGKTHLAHSLARNWQASHPDARVVATTGADFARAWERPAGDDFESDDGGESIGDKCVGEKRVGGAQARSRRAAWNMVALFVLDNIDDLSGKPAAQRELCSALDLLTSFGGRAILTARTNPARDPRLSPALSSRLASGLVLPLAKLGKAGRAAVVAELLLARGLSLSQVAIDRIAATSSAGVPELSGIVLRLEMTARSEGRVLDEAYVCEHVSADDESAVTLRSITQRVTEHFSVKSSELRSTTRRKEIVTARSVAIYLARKLTKESLEKIGRHFAGRDHATVAYNVRKVERALKAGETETSRAIAIIKQQLLEER
jgi:chromosomal replication initiator protein